MAAAISTRCITWPPSSLPRALVCAGSTTSAISEREALTGFPGGSASLLCLGTALLRFMGLRHTRHFGRTARYRIIRKTYVRTKENPPADPRRVRGQEAGRRVFALRAGHGVHERRRPRGRERTLRRTAATKWRLRARLPDVRAIPGSRIPSCRSATGLVGGHSRGGAEGRPARALGTRSGARGN